MCEFTAKDYKKGQPRWCPGCGGYKINTQKSFADLQHNKKNQKEKLRKKCHSPLQQEE